MPHTVSHSSVQSCTRLCTCARATRVRAGCSSPTSGAHQPATPARAHRACAGAADIIQDHIVSLMKPSFHRSQHATICQCRDVVPVKCGGTTRADWKRLQLRGCHKRNGEWAHQQMQRATTTTTTPAPCSLHTQALQPQLFTKHLAATSPNRTSPQPAPPTLMPSAPAARTGAPQSWWRAARPCSAQWTLSG